MNLPDVIRDTGRSQAGAGEPPVDRVFCADLSNSNGPVFEDLVVRIQLVDIIDVFGKPLQDLAAARHEIPRQVSHESTHPDVADHHSLAGSHLQKVVDLFARLKCVPEIREGSDVDQIGADANHVVHYSRQLAQDHPDVLGALGNLDSQQFLDGHRI